MRCTPVYLKKKKPTQANLGGGGVQSWRVSSPMGPPFCPWHAWHGAFLSDRWPHMTDGILHAYNRLMRAAAAPRDWKAEFGIRNVGKKWRERYKDYNQSSEWGWSKSQLMPWSCIRDAGCECEQEPFLIQPDTPVSMVIYEAWPADLNTKLQPPEPSSSWVS